MVTNERFALKSTQNKNKARPSIKQDIRENKEKYMEQLVNGRHTLSKKHDKNYL